MGAPYKWSYGPLLKTGRGPPCRCFPFWKGAFSGCFAVSFRESKGGKTATRHPAVPRKRGASEFFGADSFPKIQLQSKMVIV